jgi:hypothetical protein
MTTPVNNCAYNGGSDHLPGPAVVGAIVDQVSPGAERPGVPLVKHTSIASKNRAGKKCKHEGGNLGYLDELTAEQKTHIRRAQRFALQSVARELLPDDRISMCMRSFGRRKDGTGPARAQVMYSEKSHKAYYAGLMTCGSIWGCPVCAARITTKRLERLKKAVAVWDGSIFMVTLTLQHVREDKLAELVEAIKDTWRKVKSGRWWKSFAARYGVAGSLSGFECTISIKNGWHPHLHVLFFSRLKAGKIVAEKVQEELYEHYSDILAKHGRYASADRGVWVDQAVESKGGKDAALKRYVTKWGLEEELVKSPVKKARAYDGIAHYSPFQLLELYGEGNSWAGLAFQEYYQTMKGKKQLNPSRGFWALFGLEDDKASDEELAAESVQAGDLELAGLTWSAWHRIKSRELRSDVLWHAERGKEGFYAFLLGYGIIRGADGYFICPDVIAYWEGSG